MMFTIASYRVEITRVTREESLPTRNPRHNAGSLIEQDKYMDEVRAKALRLIMESGMPLPR